MQSQALYPSFNLCKVLLLRQLAVIGQEIPRESVRFLAAVQGSQRGMSIDQEVKARLEATLRRLAAEAVAAS